MQKVQYGSIWLSEGGSQAPRDFQVNGEQLVQQSSIIRASASALFGRGNRHLSVSFGVLREHASVTAAQQFLWLHPQSLSKQDTTLFYQENGELIIMPSSVVHIVQQQYTGKQTRHQYQLLGRQAIITNPALPLNQEIQAMIMQTIPIPSGLSQFSVTGLSLPIVPTHVGGFVAKPLAGPELFSNVIASSITTDGWDVALSAPTPTPDYTYTYFIGL